MPRAAPTVRGRPAAHRRARRATSSTRCARWACSRASSPPRCPTAPTSQPSYLGTVVHDLPAVGTRSEPDMRRRSRRRDPDLILGSQALTPDAYPQLSAIAPTVFTGPPGADVAGQPAHGRRGDRAARRRQRPDRRLRAGRRQDGRRQRRHPLPGVGRAVHRHHDAGVRTRTTSPAVCWPLSAWIALRHNGLPTSRTSRSASPTPILDNSPDFSAADGDIVYVSFASPAAKDRAPASAGQRRVEEAVRQPRQPGVRGQQRGVADRRGHRRRPRHAGRPAVGQRPDQLMSRRCSTS